MGIKKSICKAVGESFLAKELHEYKKEIRDKIAKRYEDEIKELKKVIKEKQDIIDSFMRESKNMNESEAVVKTVTKEKGINFPRNMID